MRVEPYTRNIFFTHQSLNTGFTLTVANGNGDTAVTNYIDSPYFEDGVDLMVYFKSPFMTAALNDGTIASLDADGHFQTRILRIEVIDGED